jgi:hypothetical protein
VANVIFILVLAVAGGNSPFMRVAVETLRRTLPNAEHLN